MTRAATLVGRSSAPDPFWEDKTRAIVGYLLHAAALAGCDRSTCSAGPCGLRSRRGATHSESVRSGGAALGARSPIGDLLRPEAPGFDLVRGGSHVRSISGSGHLAGGVAGGGQDVRPVRLLASDGCLYLLGTAGDERTAALVAAFIEDIVGAARMVAAAMPNSRLDPPVGLVLDEAANYTLPLSRRFSWRGAEVGSRPLL